MIDDLIHPILGLDRDPHPDARLPASFVARRPGATTPWPSPRLRPPLSRVFGGPQTVVLNSSRILPRLLLQPLQSILALTDPVREIENELDTRLTA